MSFNNVLFSSCRKLQKLHTFSLYFNTEHDGEKKSHPQQCDFSPYLSPEYWQETPWATTVGISVQINRMLSKNNLKLIFFFPHSKTFSTISQLIFRHKYHKISGERFVLIYIFVSNKISISIRCKYKYIRLLFYYLWADLVSTLSNLQVHNFTHDDQSTAAGVSDRSQPSDKSFIKYQKWHHQWWQEVKNVIESPTWPAQKGWINQSEKVF